LKSLIALLLIVLSIGLDECDKDLINGPNIFGHLNTQVANLYAAGFVLKSFTPTQSKKPNTRYKMARNPRIALLIGAFFAFLGLPTLNDVILVQFNLSGFASFYFIIFVINS